MISSCWAALGALISLDILERFLSLIYLRSAHRSVKIRNLRTIPERYWLKKDPGGTVFSLSGWRHQRGTIKNQPPDEPHCSLMSLVWRSLSQRNHTWWSQKTMSGRIDPFTLAIASTSIRGVSFPLNPTWSASLGWLLWNCPKWTSDSRRCEWSEVPNRDEARAAQIMMLSTDVGLTMPGCISRGFQQLFDAISTRSLEIDFSKQLLMKWQWPGFRSPVQAICHVVLSDWDFVWWDDLSTPCEISFCARRSRIPGVGMQVRKLSMFVYEIAWREMSILLLYIQPLMVYASCHALLLVSYMDAYIAGYINTGLNKSHLKSFCFGDRQFVFNPTRMDRSDSSTTHYTGRSNARIWKRCNHTA